MKTRKLKIDGEERLNFKLKIEFDEFTITLFNGTTETKYQSKISILEFDEKSFLEIFGNIVENLYVAYKRGKELEENMFNIFVDQEYVEINV